MKEITIQQALEQNLRIIIDNAYDLSVIFQHDKELSKHYLNFFIMANVMLKQLEKGSYNNIEWNIFSAIMPICSKLCKTYHEYKHLL